MFSTTIAGSLPKPAWLAEPNSLWAPWRLAGAELAAAKRDATILALKLQEDRDIDVKTEHPEFAAWKWLAMEALPRLIVPFKRDTYAKVIEEFRDLAFPM